MFMTYQNQDHFWEDLRSGKIEKMIRETVPLHIVDCAAEVFNIMRPVFASEPDVEKMYGLFLNAKNEVLAIDLLASGSIGASSVYPREIIKKALKHYATGMILCHNHPSGDPTPSEDDHNTTQSVLLAAFTVGIAFLDHIIVGSDGYFSFGDCDFLQQYRDRISSFCHKMHMSDPSDEEGSTVIKHVAITLNKDQLKKAKDNFNGR